MKHILSVALLLSLNSCNNQSKPAEDKAAAPAAKVTSLAPYKAILIQHAVQDYDKWFPLFTAHDSVRKQYGITESGVGRGLEDDKNVVVLSNITDVQKAHDFASSPGLADAMKNSGVVGQPTVTYLDVLFDDTSAIPQKERLMVTHHVKDYGNWKKAFDAEGDSARTTNGLVERLLARGIDDPNTVTIIFAVTDMDKAKARVASPELKKIMTDAGVDGAPQITWFKWVVMTM